MSKAASTLAALAVFSATMAFAGALATPAYAGPMGHNWNNGPHWEICEGWKKCKAGPAIPGDTGGSEGNFPSFCNGVLGFWTAVPMPGNTTFCVAKSTADFDHNGTPDTQTCTYKEHWTRNGKVSETTVNGGCDFKQFHGNE